MTDKPIEFESVTDKLLAETARMPWHDLQRFFAQGALLHVDASLDLVRTAAFFAEDKATALEPLLSELLVKQPTNEQAREWFDKNSELWTVVVAPYVLVQEK